MFSTSDVHPSLLLLDTLMSTSGTTCCYMHKENTSVLFNSLHKQGNKQTKKAKTWRTKQGQDLVQHKSTKEFMLIKE